MEECHTSLKEYEEKIHQLKIALEEKTQLHDSYQLEICYLQQSLEQEKQKLRVRIQSIKSLEEDIVTVQHKHQEEIAHSLAIEQSKEVAERELHELGKRLFEEVDDMISIEKEQKQKIQATVDSITKELESTQNELKAVQLELNVLREDMMDRSSEGHESHEDNQIESHSPGNYILRAQLDLSNLVNHEPSRIKLETDDLMMAEFKEFWDTIDTVPLRKLSNLSFMKLCLKSDIEPCLRFGPQPRLTAKKIIDTILSKSCFIEVADPDYFLRKMNTPVPAKTRLWDRFTAITQDTLSCQACGREVDTKNKKAEVYKFRLSYFDEWSCIDRYCRDRILAVNEFYTFLRRLRVGVYKNRSLSEVNEECNQLRLQMMLSRMGSLPLMLNTFGLDSTKLGTASSGS
ncbi:hypothetical protein BDB01DRAFT_728073 [Pilobolus umbonatus]|nr:hypothetical protein BDB01DRAFT_728073 [Pilobolus umbonatus]